MTAVKCLSLGNWTKLAKSFCKQPTIVGFPRATLWPLARITKTLVPSLKTMLCPGGTAQCETFVGMALARYVVLVNICVCSWCGVCEMMSHCCKFNNMPSPDIPHQPQHFALSQLGTEWTNGGRAYVHYRTHDLRRKCQSSHLAR